MATRKSTGSWLAGGLLSLVLALTGSVVLLVFELITAMVIYVFLNLFYPELFGDLVRRSADIFRWLADLILPLFGEASNQAYASLIGEMSPKAVLLVLISLTVGAVVRLLIWGIKRLAGV
ncbi:MAG: hypothetical protein AAFR70_15250 [Pseudomonadota bacterium]